MKVIFPVGVMLCAAAFLVPGAALFVCIAAIPFALIAFAALFRGFISWAGIWSRVGGFTALVLAGAMFCCGTAVAGEVPGLSAITRRADEAQDEAIPTEYRNALQQANVYANSLNMSRKGVFQQLVSEDGGKFSKAAATYAVQYVQTNWKENAIETATVYYEHLGMSRGAVYDQLREEKFTKKQAKWAVEQLR